MPPKQNATPLPTGSSFSGLLFLASALGGFLFEYSATMAYDASQPYDWIIESMSDLGVTYRQVHILKHYTVSSWRSKTFNFGLMWLGSMFAFAHFYLFLQTRATSSTSVASLRSARNILAGMFAVGAFLMATIHGGPREKHWNTIGWHWNGFAAMVLAGNFNSILAGLKPHQVGGLDGNFAYRAASFVLGAVGVGSLMVFYFGLGEWNHVSKLGLWQRASIYPVAIWEVITGLGLIAGRLGLLEAKAKRA